MLEILKFVFSSFWTWAGTAILLTIAAEAMSSPLRVFTAFLLGIARRG